MPLFLPFVGAVLPLLITPGLFFHYETTPKLVALALAVALALPRTNFGPLLSSRNGRLFVGLSVANIGWFALATACSSRPMMSLLGSQWREFGFAGFSILVAAGLVAAAQLAEHPERKVVLLRSIAVSGLIVSIYGIAQYFDLDPFQSSAAYHAFAGDDAIVRPPGTFGHADYFAWWLAVEFFCALRLGGLLGGAAASLSAVAIVLTGTRAGILAVVAGLLVSRLRPRQMLAGAAVVAALAAFAFTPPGARLRHRIAWVGDEPIGGARPLLWRDSAKMAIAHPLFGTGPETFLASFGRYESEALAKLYPDFHHESPHNLALDAATSAGLPALFLLLGWALLAGATPAFVASAVASLFSGAMLAPLLLTMLVIGLKTPASKPETLNTAPARSSRRLVPWIAIPVTAFAILLGVSDFRLARFDRGGPYVRLPVAAEDIYCSRRLAATSLRTAIEAAARATTTADDSANAWYNLAVFTAAAGDIAGTRRSLEEAARQSPNWFKPHWTLARLLRQTGDPSRARIEAERAVLLDARHHSEVTEALNR
ncbi:MAG: O-antigen ligase family protein [Acidobacteriota bacterium]|nr:O-antigen ligase family protein [Acidobacteriota bacterium]